MADKFTFNCAGEIQKVEFALARAEYTHADVDELVSGDILQLVREVINGMAEICRIERLAPTAAVPVPTPKWREENGVIRFSVTSDGTTGEEWIKRLEDKGFRVGNYAKSVLRSDDFKPTKGVTTEIAILKGMLFTDTDRITKKIRADADKRKLQKPNAEVACLIREKFSDEEIKATGLVWVVAMHDPIKDSDGYLHLLLASRDVGGSWLNACYGNPDRGWDRRNGFAFAVSQVSA